MNQIQKQPWGKIGASVLTGVFLTVFFAVAPVQAAVITAPEANPQAAQEQTVPHVGRAMEAKPQAVQEPIAVRKPTEAEVGAPAPQAPAFQPPKLVQAAKPQKVESDSVARKGTHHVRICRFGSVKEYAVKSGTVADVLHELQLDTEKRVVYPAADCKIEEGMTIHILAPRSAVEHEDVQVPFTTKLVPDPALAFGKTKVEKAGVPGKDKVTYAKVPGPKGERKYELARQRVMEPAEEVVRQGIAQAVWTPEGYKPYHYKIVAEATAYTWGGGATGMTSVGLMPKRGIVAVDPRKIPYYTKMYIPGYGFALAGDTGGAIKGHRVDLFMDTLHECFQWGRRDVEIYILK